MIASAALKQTRRRDFEEIRQQLLGRIEWAAVGKQVFPGRPAITPQIAMKPATLCFVFDPGFVRSAYVPLCVDSERSVSSGRLVQAMPSAELLLGELMAAQRLLDGYLSVLDGRDHRGLAVGCPL